jgi:hypothetical protein
VQIDKFYGTDKSDTITYLEFGEVNLREGKKKIWDFRLHQKAYDWLMLGRYANDIVAYNAMSRLLDESAFDEIVRQHESEIHHKDETTLSLNKLLALCVIGKGKTTPSFFEFGHTVFGCIEGMEFAAKLLKLANSSFPSCNLRDVTWYGFDISEMFNELSMLLHAGYSTTASDDFNLLPSTFDVFFAKGITLLYAVRNAEQLSKMLNKASLCIFDYSFAIGEDFETTIGSGKTVRYINVDSFMKSYKDAGKTMYVRKNKSYRSEANNSVFIDCVYGDKAICDEYIAADKQVRHELKEKFISESGILKILDLNEASGFEWVSMDEFIGGIRG